MHVNVSWRFQVLVFGFQARVSSQKIGIHGNNINYKEITKLKLFAVQQLADFRCKSRLVYFIDRFVIQSFVTVTPQVTGKKLEIFYDIGKVHL